MRACEGILHPLHHVSDPGDLDGVSYENTGQNRLGKAFSELLSYTAVSKGTSQPKSIVNPSLSTALIDNSNGRISASEGFRVSLSSAVSSSSQGSCPEDFDALGDVYIWGEGIGDGLLGGGVNKVGSQCSLNSKLDALLPKALESTVVLDVHGIACGGRHAVLVTRQGEIFSWGEESGGRLGHGVEADVSHPKIIDTLSGTNVELVACGEYHTCAVTLSGDLYTWGDGTHNYGLLGHGSEVSHWIPQKVGGQMEGIRVSYISCGAWHTAVVTSAGQLFTFGDGSFGALGHGDHITSNFPREVETLRGLRTTKVACGVWHTAAAVEAINELSDSGTSASPSSRKLYTWGDGDKGRLGHGDNEPRLVPECVAALIEERICQVACGNDLTVALTTAGRVYTMGSTAYGQLGSATANGKLPTCVEGEIANSFVEEVACGSYHVAVLTSKNEVYTWGKGLNGQLGHGDNNHRNTPTIVDVLKDKQVKNVACGSKFTVVICIHKWVSSADHSVCSGCHNPFGFRRKRHNCYNCGLVFCKACSSKKSLKASLAPNLNKPYRVCDDCFNKLKKIMESSSVSQNARARTGNIHYKSNGVMDKETWVPKLQATLSRLSSFGAINNAESMHSRLASRATSPVLGTSSPIRSSEDFSEDSKRANDTLTQEIISLRAQVQELTCKSKNLEAELEKTSKKLLEVTAIAADEAEKCKSAKEVIKSLAAQLKEMAEKMPEGQTAIVNSSTVTGQNGSNLNQLSTESLSMSINSRLESNGISKGQTLSTGIKALNEKAEWVVQDEPGVYITLSTLPGGFNELKRVRFSRRHFTEAQAEKWWADFGAKVCERHKVKSTD
ncbi:PH, RCC1 and FYVE domains-containing protein 1-like isoform X3 [Cucumis sativus]|uniref:PH, RCC1 and FYVE domains-containing protein 1-like isoform X3 n=1 Tax=Cucumis sativus TaxID=3659 RepID=UPI0012F48A10|nr:PH, RCC1 and FYVE domains-containing protein 1-like isoform X3 [Cucumis sativus]